MTTGDMNRFPKHRLRLIPVVMLFLSGVLGCAGQPLEPWHTVRLDSEFEAGMLGDEVRTTLIIWW